MSRIEKLLKAIINNTTYDEPRLSRIEEIFYSILYSLPYNANAQSRIEALLLALKESGLYDERTLSRIEEILKCKLDGSTYTGWIGSRVEMLLNEWELSEIIEATFTSFPIIIKANGEPLLDYTIYGNTVQNDAPSPDTPIMPQGTGERTGNLFDVNGTYSLKSAYVTIADNSIKFENVPSGNVARIYYSAQYPAGTYHMSCVTSGSNYYATRLFSDSPFTGATYNAWFEGYYRDFAQSGFSTSLTFDNDFKIGFIANAVGGATFTISDIMLSASEADFEPYGYKIPISSANTTTPVYLGEVQTTRKIKKLVLTGEENWGKDSPDITNYMYSLRVYHERVFGICSHFLHTNTYPRTFAGFRLNGESYYYMYINIGPELQEAQPSGNTVAGLKEYLSSQYAAGTPVTVWYVLAEPETAVVNEPLMKIGDYADTLSMEQAGMSIPTLNEPNNTVIDVETDVKPSKMYVKYNGEGTPVYITSDDKLYITSNNEIYVLKR